jgi:hypothetical protein
MCHKVIENICIVVKNTYDVNIRQLAQQLKSPSHSRTSQMHVPQSEAPRIPSMQVMMSKLSKH